MTAGRRHKKTRKTRKARGGGLSNKKPGVDAPRESEKTRSTAPFRGKTTQPKPQPNTQPNPQSGGVMYSYGFDPATGVGGAGHIAVDTAAPVDPATGGKIFDPFGTSPFGNAKVTGGRRRKSKKSGKRHSKKTSRRTRKMRGGAWSPGNVNAGAVRAEFVGNTGPTGPFTYGTYVGSASKVPAPGGPVMGPDGVMKA